MQARDVPCTVSLPAIPHCDFLTVAGFKLFSWLVKLAARNKTCVSRRCWGRARRDVHSHAPSFQFHFIHQFASAFIRPFLKKGVERSIPHESPPRLQQSFVAPVQSVQEVNSGLSVQSEREREIRVSFSSPFCARPTLRVVGTGTHRIKAGVRTRPEIRGRLLLVDNRGFSVEIEYIVRARSVVWGRGRFIFGVPALGDGFRHV